MSEPTRYVHIVDEVPELSGLEQGPVLLHSLEGFLDAGNAAALAVHHLLAQSAGRVVASFDIDAFFDYRARRPPMTFAEDRYQGYETPRLVVRLCHDRLGTPYLLMSGPEPDIRWEAFGKAVRTVVEHFGVRLVVSLGSVPMAVPHTRPVQLTNHATAQRLLVQENVWRGEIRVPASAQSLVELRLGEWGHDAMGFVAHIPHYVAQFDYPQAAVALLEGLEDVTGLQWDVDALKEAGESRQVEIATQIADSDDVRDVVTGLEQQYDAYHSKAANLLAEDEALPSGEEIGAQFEQFLARLEEPEE
jgi:predicted ATP-grasp superfamily ATP-dependent carboligase